MKNKQMLNGAEVENLITKFYYKNNHLCFQILIQCGLENMIAYKEYSDYAEYKTAYSQLIDMKTNNESITIPLSEQEISYMSLT